MINWQPFSPKALDFIHNSTARLNIAHGAVRSSKTITCTVRWLTFIASGPQGDLVMLGRTAATLQRNVTNDLLDIVGPRNYKWINRQQGELKLFNRRVYCFGANNEDAEAKIRGATFAGALCDEVSLYPQSVFNQLMARLSIDDAKCFCTCNPDSPYHWFYTDYIQNPKISDKKVWKFSMEDNLSLSPTYIASLKQMYTGVWYERMILGNWVAAEGRVYDMFDPHIHMANLTTLDLTHAKYLVGCDYGTSTVMTWGLYAVVGGKTYKLKEFYYDAQAAKNQLTDYEFADMFTRWIGAIRPWAVYCDPSAASWKVTLQRRGFRVMNANNDVLNGIRYVATCLNTKTFIMDRSCLNTAKEYASYVWDPNAQRMGQDKPLKEHDHTCLTGDTLVWTTNGKRPIKDLLNVTGKCFCVNPQSGRLAIREFFNVHKLKPVTVYELELVNGHKVRATADHKFYSRPVNDPAGKKFRTLLDINARLHKMQIADVRFGARLEFVNIKSIRPAGKEPVFNMTVDKLHNYIVNDGIVVKNCDCDRYVLYTESLGGLSGVY